MKSGNSGYGPDGDNQSADQFDISVENDLLRLQLAAEHGGVYEAGVELSPEVENHFLKTIIAFEHAYARCRKLSIAELLEFPSFPAADDMDEETLTAELRKAEELLRGRNIDVAFKRERDNRFKYIFLTGEFMNYQTDDLDMPGMSRHFSYEDFHTDHELEIRDRTIEFLRAWYIRSVKRCSFLIADELIGPEGQGISPDVMLNRISKMFEAYKSYRNFSFSIESIDFSLAGESSDYEGIGHSGGSIQYEAQLENGEMKLIKGDFKFYFCREKNWWSIYFFYMPGFNK